MNKQPQLMDVFRMRDILTPHLSQIREHVFMNSELAMVRGDHTVFSLLMHQKPPFTINDHRFGIVMSGEADINFNLQDRHLKSGTHLRFWTLWQLPHALCARTDAVGLQWSGA